MHTRGKLIRPHGADYLTIDAKMDGYKALWKKRVVLGWYPGKTPADTHLASFLLENVHRLKGELESVAIFETGGHSLRSLSLIAGLPVSTVGAVLQRWSEYGFIERSRIGDGRRGKLKINWDRIRTGVPAPALGMARPFWDAVHGQTGAS
jgi:hypothetical protein